MAWRDVTGHVNVHEFGASRNLKTFQDCYAVLAKSGIVTFASPFLQPSRWKDPHANQKKTPLRFRLLCHIFCQCLVP